MNFLFLKIKIIILLKFQSRFPIVAVEPLFIERCVEAGNMNILPRCKDIDPSPTIPQSRTAGHLSGIASHTKTITL